MTTWTDPFFVVGFGRSGTTLLAAMLDRHPRLCVTPETAFFTEAVRPLERRRDLSHEPLLDAWLGFPRFGDLGVCPHEVTRRFHAAQPTAEALLAATLGVYRDRHAKPRVGEKTPAHLWYTPRIFDAYPSARVVCLVRDGRDCVNSMLKTPWGRDNPIHIALRWATATRLGEHFARRYGPDRFHLARYEDLLADPVGVLGGVMAFLGEWFHPCQLDPSVKAGVVPAWESGWKGKVDKHLDPSRCYAWRRENRPEFTWKINALIGGSLRRAGYDDTDLDGCPPSLRARLLAQAAVYRQARKPHHLRTMIRLHDWIAQRLPSGAPSVRLPQSEPRPTSLPMRPQHRPAA